MTLLHGTPVARCFGRFPLLFARKTGDASVCGSSPRHAVRASTSPRQCANRERDERSRFRHSRDVDRSAGSGTSCCSKPQPPEIVILLIDKARPDTFILPPA